MGAPDCICRHDFVDGQYVVIPTLGCEFCDPATSTPPPVVAPIRKLERGPDPGTIRMLEDLLGEAREGKITGLVAVSVDRDAFCRTWQTGHFRSQDILWSFEFWKTRQIQRESE